MVQKFDFELGKYFINSRNHDISFFFRRWPCSNASERTAFVGNDVLLVDAEITSCKVLQRWPVISESKYSKF